MTTLMYLIINTQKSINLINHQSEVKLINYNLVLIINKQMKI